MNKRPIRTRSLSLKCAELRCKKSLRWQTYSLLINRSEYNERKKRRNKIVHRGHIQHYHGMKITWPLIFSGPSPFHQDVCVEIRTGEGNKVNKRMTSTN